MTKPCRRGHIEERYKDGGCRKCAADRYQNNREQCISKAKAYAASRPRETMLLNAKHRAKAKGLAFDLTVADIIIPDTCPVLGTLMVRPELDQIQPGQGYIRGNVRVISGRANRLKSDATLNELRLVAADAEKIHKFST